MTRLLRLAVDVRPEEIRALLLSFTYFFCLLCSYFILRPLRDEAGVASGVENLQWLFTGTFFAMLAAVPVYGWAVARFPRRNLIPIVYGAFIVMMAIFFTLLRIDALEIWASRAFFIWVSVFNLFVVSVFWSFMSDVFRSDQGKRLFAFIAAGGTAGAMLGPTITILFAEPLGPVNLLPVSGVFLAMAVGCAIAIRGHGSATPDTFDDQPIGGGLLAGITEIVRSPYLLKIAAYIALISILGTFLYFAQATIVRDAFDDPADRTRLFAAIDLAVNLTTLVLQLAITGRLIGKLGLGPALMCLPAVMLVGFAALAAAPLVAILIAFQAIQRAANFAVSNPAREILFTVVTPEQKYKAKNVADTALFRGGDVVGGFAYHGLRGAGLEIPAIAGIAAVGALAWLVLARVLGRDQANLAARPTTQSDARPQAAQSLDVQGETR